MRKEFFQKYFFVHEQSAVENSFSTYVCLCYDPDGLFWLNLYMIVVQYIFMIKEYYINTTIITE